MHLLPVRHVGLLSSQRLCRFALLIGLAASLCHRSSAQTPQTAAPPPVAPDPIEGLWTGKVTAPQGVEADIGLAFFRTKHGNLIFRLNFPAMFTYDATFEIPVETDGHGNYTITPAFNTSLHLDGDRLTGSFTLGKLPLELRRGGSFPPKPAPPSHPAAPAPLWTHALGSGTWAPPVVDQNTVYIGTSDGKFHAVNAVDGSSRWAWSGAKGIDGRAVVGADTIWFVDTGCNLVALNRADGSLRWRTPLHDEKIAGRPVPDNPTFNHRAATPLLLDGVLYVGSSDGGLYALDAATGTRLWRHESMAPVFSGVALQGTDTLMFGTMDGSVVLLDRHTQKETLRVRTGGGVVTTPLVAGGKLIVGSRDYILYGFNLTDGSLAWRFSYWFSWIESTPVLRDGLLYVGASDFSRVTALDPATGRSRWSTEVHGMNWGTPLVTEDRVFTGTASQNLPGTVIAHTGGLLALDRATGNVLWRLVSPPTDEGKFGGYAGSLALAGDQVIAAGFDGNLVALPAK